MDVFKVLVVDDEAGICSGISRILENFKVSYPFMDEDISFEVIQSSTGEDALEILKTTVPEIILLDNKLPGIQGVEVLEYVKKNRIDSVVVMITSFASLELAVKATNTGAYDFIPKPFTPQELKSSMENITKHIFLKRVNRKLNETGKQVRYQFLSYLSHELKAPLNALEGYLTMMEKKQMGNEIEKYAQMIDRSLLRVKGMRELIMDMLDLTKLQSPASAHNFEQVELVKLARNSIDTIKPYSIQKDIKIIFETKNEINFMAVPEDMEIIFNNLLSNAVKYNKDKGVVDFKILQEDDKIIIKVTDTGIGLSNEELSSLFTDFSRIRKPETKNIPGSGLGLSIVKKIAERYNGNVTVESTPELGSTFIVTLPYTSII